MNARVMRKYPWGYRAQEVATGRVFDVTHDQIDVMARAGRVKKGQFRKGNVLAILRDEPTTAGASA